MLHGLPICYSLPAMCPEWEIRNRIVAATVNRRHEIDLKAAILFESMLSYFNIAQEAIDSVLQALDGSQEQTTDSNGIPNPPEDVVQHLSALSHEEFERHIGSILSAATNLGLAYEHFFGLMNVMSRSEICSSTGAVTLGLVELLEALPRDVQDDLSRAYEQTPYHDFEIELGAVPLKKDTDESKSTNNDLHTTLTYWEEGGLIGNRLNQLVDASQRSTKRIFLPYRTILALDRMIDKVLKPKIGRSYTTIEENYANYVKGPVLSWIDEEIVVSLPRRLGRNLEAKWKPSLTTVIRIREAGTNDWRFGFETPLNTCSFVDLTPDTSYELALSQKNEQGESERRTEEFKTGPQKV